MPFYDLSNQDVQIPLINDEEKFKAFILSLPPGVVIIDTLAMMVNSKGWVEGKWDVTPVMRVLNQLKAKGYTFVLVLHSLKGDPKTIKSLQELLAQVDHVVALYPVKSKGSDEEKEDSEDSPNKPKILFCGTRADLKSRYDKSIYWLRFDPNPESTEKGFKLVERNVESLRDIHQRLMDWVVNEKKCKGRELETQEYPTRVSFEKMVKQWGYKNPGKLIDQGYGLRYWNWNEVKGKGQSSHHYFPNWKRLIKEVNH